MCQAQVNGASLLHGCKIVVHNYRGCTAVKTRPLFPRCGLVNEAGISSDHVLEILCKNVTIHCGVHSGTRKVHKES